MNKYFLMAGIAIATPALIVPIQTEASVSDVQSVLYSANDQNYSVDFEVFTEALNASVLKDLAITYIQIDNNYYLFETFTSALNAFGSLEEAINVITSDSSYQENVTNIVEGVFDPETGGFTGSAKPEVAFRILSIE